MGLEYIRWLNWLATRPVTKAAHAAFDRLEAILNAGDVASVYEEEFVKQLARLNPDQLEVCRRKLAKRFGRGFRALAFEETVLAARQKMGPWVPKARRPRKAVTV